MQACSAIKPNGIACSFHVKPGETLCGTHKRSAAIRVARVQAEANGPAPRDEIVQARAEVNRLDDLYQALVLQLRRQRAAAREQERVIHAMHGNLIQRFMDLQVARERAAAIEAAAQPFVRDPVGDVNLRAFSQDNQSVHRESIQSASTIAINVLLERPVPHGQNTIAEIEAAWRVFYRGDGLEQVLAELKEDVGPVRNLAAFGQSYTVVLDHLWATIKQHEHKRELARRLFQELRDGLRMCSNGKMCRLLNVLQGFDGQIVASISRDAFQSKFATLASLPLNDRQAAAVTVFAEYGIPEVERQVWLDSLLEV